MADRRVDSLIKNTSVLALGTIFPKLAVFITLPILTANLSTEEYGTYDLILVLVSMVLPIATLQIHSAAFRFLIDRRDDTEYRKRIISNIYVFVLGISVLTLTVFYFIIRNKIPGLGFLICLYFLMDTFACASRYVIRGLGKNIHYSISAVISALGQVLFIYLLVGHYQWGLRGGIFALLVAESFSCIYLVLSGRLYLYFRPAYFSWGQIKELLAYSWPLVPNNFSSWVIRASNRLIIAASLGLTANGIFGVANKIPAILGLAHSTFNMAWQENASITSSDADVAHYYSKTFDQLYRFAAGLMGLLVAITPFLFRLLIRGSYDEAYPHILILNISMFFCLLSSFWGGIYVAYKKTLSVGLTAAIAAAFNVSMTASLIRFWGLYAASIASLASYLFLCVYRIIDCRKFISMKYDYRMILLSLLIVVGECFMSTLQFNIGDIVNLVVGSLLFVVLNKSMLISVGKRIMKKKP